MLSMEKPYKDVWKYTLISALSFKDSDCQLSQNFFFRDHNITCKYIHSFINCIIIYYSV